MNRTAQLRNFAVLYPHNPLLWCDLLDSLLSEGQVDDARACLAQMPSELRMSAATRFREARCALMQRDFVGCIEILQILLTESPTPAIGIRHDLAYAQAELGQDSEALQTLAVIEGEGDDVAAAVILKARILYRGRHYTQALAVLEPVLAGTRTAEMYGLRSLLQLDLGESALAAQEAAKALAIDPAQHEASLVVGTLALWERRVDESTAIFERILVTQPRSGRALLGLGENIMLRGDVPVARSLLERASVEMPEHIGTWHALAWCQLMEGDLAGAHRSFDRAFAIDRTFGETHGGLALIYALRGERADAEESIKRAKRLDPKGQSARYAQSVLILDEGRPDEARRIVADILARTPLHGVAVSPDFIFQLRELVRPRG